MVIDAHVHIGTSLGIIIPPSMVLESMEKYNIDCSLISSLDAVEADFDQNLLDPATVCSQDENNQRAIDVARQNPGKFRVLLFAKAYSATPDESFEKMLVDNKDIVCGIKVHPYHNKVRIDSEKVQAYIRMAEKHNLAVMIHTANDECSDIMQVYEMAKKYPKVRFVMAHAGLGTDNSQAIWILKQGLGNVYVDTAWVNPDKAVQIIRECGMDKILFGTDNPIDGVDTYAHPEFYQIYLNTLKDELTEEEYNALMCENAKMVYQL